MVRALVILMMVSATVYSTIAQDLDGNGELPGPNIDTVDNYDNINTADNNVNTADNNVNTADNNVNTVNNNVNTVDNNVNTADNNVNTVDNNGNVNIDNRGGAIGDVGNGDVSEKIRVEDNRPCPPEAKLSRDSKCKNVGEMYPFGDKCQGYYVCDMLCRSVKFQCGPGTAFDEISKVCDYPYNVKCNA